MKQLLFLVAAVVVLVASWFVFKATLGRPDPPPAAPRFATLSRPQDPNDRPALVRSAHQLWDAPPGKYEPADCIGFIDLLATRLEDAEWRAVSAPVFAAWLNLRQVASARQSVVALNDRLLVRFARKGSMSELEGMIRVAGNNSFDADTIDAVLDTVFQEEESRGGSRALELVAASVRFGDWSRARRWVDRMAAAPDAPDNIHAFAARMGPLLQLGLTAAKERRYDVPGLAVSWAAFADDDVTRKWVRPVVLDIAGRAVRAGLDKRGGLKTGELISKTAEQPGSAQLWDKVVRLLQGSVARDEYADIPLLADLVRTYGDVFQQGDYAARAWLKVADLGAERWWGNPIWVVEHLRRALVLAPDEKLKSVVIKRILEQYLEAQEFAQAQKFADQEFSEIKEESNRKYLEGVVVEVREKEEADRLRVAKELRIQEDQKLRGQLKYMKEQLEKARKQKMGPEDVASIEKVIRDLESKLKE